ncbi:MAG: M56 family metallopeptidase, partial [Flavobacterium sp.]
MNEFLFKSAISMAVLLAVYHLFLEREKIHKFKRFYLISALVFSITLPFISITIPKYVTTSTPKTITTNQVTMIHEVGVAIPIQPTSVPEIVSKTEVSQSTILKYLSIGIYAVVTLTFSIRFGRNIFRFYKLKAANPNVPYKNATLVLLEEKVLPYTFLSTIYLNGDEYKQRKIEPELFTHELTHVRERHTLDILFIELLRTVMWFNPLLYFYKRAIRLNHEFLADDSTIDHHLDITSYQSLLLAKLTPVSVSSLASSINFGTTKKRFIMMTKTTNKVKGLLLRISVVPVVTGLTFLLATQTVIYAKSAGHTAPAVIVEQPDNTIPAMIPDAIPGVVMEQAPMVTDSATARRDEYYKNVRIKIEDKSRNLSIDTKYEQLTEAQKDLYLTEVP